MDGLLVFVPVLGAPLLHAGVLRYDRLRSLKRPLDGGATVRGRRLFGDNKTWRGALVMWTGVVGLTLALSAWPAYWNELPEELRSAGPLAVGALIGAGTVVGELPNSFLKRQLGIPPGARRRSPVGVALTILDQADFVPAIVLLLAPIWLMPLDVGLAGFAIVVIVHLALNVVGYAVGARTAPI
jgi:CDP-2,3-bis-(O-geranylgeranyl)-sn-glycerol synthase